MPREPGSSLGPYRIEAPIGAGGMGAVYRATDTRLDRTVAIKTIEGGFNERFEREAKTIASLNHPHICTLFDVGENYLVMEYIQGAPLKGPLPVNEVVRLGAQIAEALDAAHRKGITHRDLKPGNVLVTKSGVKVIDFGLAKGGSPVRGEQDVTLTKPLTSEGTILGTVPYMSPEQLHGAEADARSDIFALGCVLYEMLTGRRAFDGKSQVSIMAAILEREPAPLSEVQPTAPAWLDRVIRGCLCKSPDDRWQSARDVAKELREPLAETVSKAPPPKRPWALAGTVLALGLAAAWITVARFGQHPTANSPAVRFQLYPPPGGRLDRSGLAASPDGRTLAFVATVQGRRGLWVRPIDAAESRLLPDTVDATVPFWSPDSRSIAYSAGGKLWRIDISGGSPQAICDVPTLREGTWGPDGVIVFAESVVGLHRVKAAGGIPERFTTLDRARNETGHSHPRILPNGRFLFYVRSSQAENEGIYVSSLSKPQDRSLLLRTTVIGADVAGGYLLWRRGTSLVAQPLDLDRMKLSGEPSVVTYPVGGPNRFGATTYSVSAAGVMMFFRSDGTSQLTWFDRTRNSIGVLGEPNLHGSFAISPDGLQAVATRAESGLWIADLSRNVWTILTPNRAGFPVWTHDGRGVIFKTFSPPNLFRVEIGNGGESRLTESPNNQWATDVSGDGRQLLYYEMSPETRRDLWILPLKPDGKPDPAAKPRLYLRTRFNEYAARFSPGPNPSWVAYQSDETGKLEVYAQTYPEPHGKVPISTGGGNMPEWGADGRSIYYVSLDDKLMEVAVNLRDPGLSPSKPRELFAVPWDGELIGSPYQVALDGKRFLVRATRENGPLTAEVIVNWPALLKEGR